MLYSNSKSYMRATYAVLTGWRVDCVLITRMNLTRAQPQYLARAHILRSHLHNHQHLQQHLHHRCEGDRVITFCKSFSA